MNRGLDIICAALLLKRDINWLCGVCMCVRACVCRWSCVYSACSTSCTSSMCVGRRSRCLFRTTTKFSSQLGSCLSVCLSICLPVCACLHGCLSVACITISQRCDTGGQPGTGKGAFSLPCFKELELDCTCMFGIDMLRLFSC
jgi:hypothetical protein